RTTRSAGCRAASRPCSSTRRACRSTSSSWTTAPPAPPASWQHGHCRSADRELVERAFPQARAIASENRGFAHACNLAAATCDAPWLLFLNPDTEVLEGSLAELMAGLRREAGVACVRQLDDSGAVIPTMRMFPSASRALGDSIGLERFPGRPDWLGERDLR